MINKIIDAVEKNRDLIVSAHDYIWNNPETGYREWKTTKYLSQEYEKLGYEVKLAGDIPGFCAELDTGRKGPTVLVLGELDSLICPSHEYADAQTGAAHICGHHAQSAALLGVAAALKEDGVTEPLCGKIILCAVPAEELIEVEFRMSLKGQGIIKYMGGKPEFLRRGYFDGVDIALMVHTSTNLAVNQGNNGCIAKTISYKGVSAHAGGSPWNGCNALYAATAGLNAVNSLRETFKEDDCVRVHPIITHGGEAVNAIPELVKIESYVRGKTFEAIERENKKVNRAFCGAAVSLGAKIEIDDVPGYSPLVNDRNLIKLAEETAKEVYPEHKFINTGVYSTGSTDMGDLSTIMPAVHPLTPGAKGKIHGDDFYIDSVQLACIDCAKWQVAMLCKLLSDNAVYAQKVIDDFEPRFKSKDDFLAYLDSLETHGDKVIYEDDKATVIL